MQPLDVVGVGVVDVCVEPVLLVPVPVFPLFTGPVVPLVTGPVVPLVTGPVVWPVCVDPDVG